MRGSTGVQRSKLLEQTAVGRGIPLVYLFGSQANAGSSYLAREDLGPADALADLDVGVRLRDYDRFTPIERARFYGDLHGEFQDLFKPSQVDLVLLDETHSVFQSEALCSHCIYAVSDAVREAYEIRVLTRAADFRPTLHAFYKERLEDV